MTHPLVHFRKASSEDAPTLVEFQIQMAWESEGVRLNPGTCSEGVNAVFRTPHAGTYHVAYCGTEILGCLLIIPEWSDWRNQWVWWIHSVYIKPAWRRKGIFSQFYAFIQDQAKAAGNVRGLRLYVDRTNTLAQRVYQKLGMTNHHYDLYEWIQPAEEDSKQIKPAHFPEKGNTP
ncbi:MAG: GNAT family N-acetyltransferase [Bdellovibrionia bacterium]